MLNKSIMMPKAYDVPCAHSDPGWTSSPGFHVNFVQNRSEIVTRGFLRMLNTNMATLRAPGAQGGPLLLEFHVYFVQNLPEIVTRGFSRMLNTNMTTP